MAKPNHIIIKRLCIFFLGLAIGLYMGHQHGVTKTHERIQKRMLDRKERMRDAVPPPRKETFFKKNRKRDYTPQNAGDVK